MSDLKSIIKNQIAAHGVMPISEYMQICLSHPDHGYYMQQTPFGREGDFITAPDVSQMFGEMIAVWVQQTWQNLGAPEKFYLVEMGGGRGQMMADILRVLRRGAEISTALSIHMIETSPRLVKEQQKMLRPFKDAISWSENLENIPQDSPVIFITNELLDALPIDQYIYQNGAWMQRVVTADFTFDILKTDLPQSLSNYLETYVSPLQGDIVEYSPTGKNLMDKIASMIERQGGAGLFIDYGYSDPVYGDTFQAMKDHGYVGVFETPGQADLTAHVNFGFFADQLAAYDIDVAPVITQAEFLNTLGIALRARGLMAQNPSQQHKIQSDYNRLVHPDQMGDLFKVLSFINVKQAEG